MYRLPYIAGSLLILLVISLYSYNATLIYNSQNSEPVVVDGLGYEWRYGYLHGLTSSGGFRDSLGDYRDSRDVVAWYYVSGADYVFFRVDLLDLAYGAEVASGPGYRDALDLYLLIGWDGAPGYQEWLPDFILDSNGKSVKVGDYPWVLAVAIYDANNIRVYKYDWSYWTPSNLSISVAFNAQWDLVELSLPASFLRGYGWDSSKIIWCRIASTWVDSSGVKWLSKPVPGYIVSGDPNTWYGAWFSNQTTGTAKLILLHHGNQHLTDNRGLNNPSSRNSYGYILWIHEDVSRLAGRRIPVMIHMSGTLMASFLWWDPGFIEYVRSLVEQGIIVPVGGVWAEYITAYFYDNFNDPSAYLALDYNYRILGYRPLTAWVPERTWDDARTGIAWTLSKYYKAVVLDGNTHHDEWSPGTNNLKPHKYDETRTNGNTLYVFFIHWDTQQKLLSNTDGGLNRDLRLIYLDKAMSWDQQQVFIYADDWEKAAGIAGWPTDPSWYENAIRWIAMHPWIQVVTIDDVVGWLEKGYWTPEYNYYCGYDTYVYIKQWVNNYPYDYRRAYDGWYWGTLSEKAFSELGDPSRWNYRLGDNIVKLGDIWSSGTILYELLAPGRLIDSTPRNELWWMTIMSLNALLYETAWHEESDWDSDGLQDIPGWARGGYAHVRLTSIYFLSARWLDDVRNNRVTGVQYIRGDLDWDGIDEVVVYNNRLFAWIDPRGGAIPYVVVYDPSRDTAWIPIGVPMVYWGSMESEAWYGGPQVGLFVDDYLDYTGANYYGDTYNISRITFLDNGSLTVELSSPDKNRNGVADIVKKYLFNPGSPEIITEYSVESGKLYITIGSSIDLLQSLYTGQTGVSFIGSPNGGQMFTMYNNLTSNAVEFTPLINTYYTGPQDLVTYTLQYVFKLYTNGSQAPYTALARVRFGSLQELTTGLSSTTTTTTTTATTTTTITTTPTTTVTTTVSPTTTTTPATTATTTTVPGTVTTVTVTATTTQVLVVPTTITLTITSTTTVTNTTTATVTSTETVTQTTTQPVTTTMTKTDTTTLTVKETIPTTVTTIEHETVITTVTVISEAFTGLTYITMALGAIVVLLIVLMLYSRLKGRYS